MLLAIGFLSCEKTTETVISGKVVTFREDSLLYIGPIEVTLYKSVGSPGDEVETKLLRPPYEFHFVSEATDFVYEGFQVGVDSYVPRHAKHYAGDADYILEGETEHNYLVNLMPRTCIAYVLINEDPQPGDYISINRIGGGAYTIHGTTSEIVMDCGYYCIDPL